MAKPYPRKGTQFYWSKIQHPARCACPKHRGTNQQPAILGEGTGCTDQDLATVWQIERTKLLSAGRVTFTTMVEAYLASRQALGRTANTLSYYHDKAKPLCTFYDAQPLTYAGGWEYANLRLSAGSKPWGVSKEFTFARQVLHHARKLGMWEGDPATCFPTLPGAPAIAKSWVSRAVWDRVLLPALTPEVAAWAGYCMAMQGRSAETARARMGDVDWQGMWILVRGSKTATSWGRVPIPPTVEDMLRGVEAWAQSVGRKPGGILFTKDPSTYRRALREAAISVGLPGLCPNDLRRTGAKWGRKAGLSDEALAGMLRHKTTRLAQTTYAQRDEDDVWQAVRGGTQPRQLIGRSDVGVGERDPNRTGSRQAGNDVAADISIRDHSDLAALAGF